MTLRLSPWDRLPTVLTTIALCLFSISAYAAEASSDTGSSKAHPVADAKKAGKEIGHGVKKSTKVIGHGFRDGTRAVGHETKKVTKEVGHETKKVTKEVGHAFRDGAHEIEGKKD